MARRNETKCPRCNGHGCIPWQDHPNWLMYTENAWEKKDVPCPRCHGSGKVKEGEPRENTSFRG